MTEPSQPRARLFVAVQPDDAALSGIERALEPLRSEPAFRGLRWTDLEKLHFTLRFLGSVPSESMPEIEQVCVAVATRSTPFDLTLAGGGAFPSPRRASVLWIGASDGAPLLVALAARLNPLLDALGFEPETRVFTPHLTVARSPKPSQLTAAVSALAPLHVATYVRELLLVRSHLGRPSARYEVIARCALP